MNMETNKIQEQLKELESKKEDFNKDIDQKINSLKIQLTDESDKTIWIDIPGTKYQVTKEVLYKGKTYNKIIKLMKPNEELLTLKLIGIICEYPELIKELKMDSSSTKDDFFFKQPFPQNERNGYVAWVYAGSGCAGLGCWGGSDDSDGSLGVRFVRKKIRGTK